LLEGRIRNPFVRLRCWLVKKEDRGSSEQLNTDRQTAFLAARDAFEQAVANTRLSHRSQAQLLQGFIDTLHDMGTTLAKACTPDELAY